MKGFFWSVNDINERTLVSTSITSHVGTEAENVGPLHGPLVGNRYVCNAADMFSMSSDFSYYLNSAIILFP